MSADRCQSRLDQNRISRDHEFKKESIDKMIRLVDYHRHLVPTQAIFVFV